MSGKESGVDFHGHRLTNCMNPGCWGFQYSDSWSHEVRDVVPWTGESQQPPGGGDDSQIFSRATQRLPSEGVSSHHTHRELTWIISRWAHFEDTQLTVNSQDELTLWACCVFSMSLQLSQWAHCYHCMVSSSGWSKETATGRIWIITRTFN